VERTFGLTGVGPVEGVVPSYATWNRAIAEVR